MCVCVCVCVSSLLCNTDVTDILQNQERGLKIARFSNFRF